MQVQGSPWVPCLPGKAIQVSTTRGVTVAHGQKGWEMLEWLSGMLFLFLY